MMNFKFLLSFFAVILSGAECYAKNAGETPVIPNAAIAAESHSTSGSTSGSSNASAPISRPPTSSEYFRIKVVDQETSRGVPLVKLTTTTGIDYYTDSAGVIAFYEPGMMDRDVFFFIESHGYSYPADGLGQTGAILHTSPGARALVVVKRENIAERLYRITGLGIYRDSVLLGDTAPIAQPLDNASVAGQDSTLTAVYQGKLFWVWGDTGRVKHPIAGNFKTTCGISELPGKGGLDPETGVNLEYFKQGDFVKSMAPLPGPYLYWLNSLISIPDETGGERLLSGWARIKPPMEAVARGMAQFNDEKQVFEPISEVPLDAIMQPDGHPFRVRENGMDYFYYPSDSRFARVRANYRAVLDRGEYEAFTCLKEGQRFDAAKCVLDALPGGRLQFSWKRNTAATGVREMDALIKEKRIEAKDAWFRMLDAETGKPVLYHGGSIYWNEHRKRWVMIFGELFGTSLLGEIWYAEGDTPLGPWGYARKIVTHKDYSFYNPVQHPEFAKHGGRTIFFEGTYTRTFSGACAPTPRYEYNQIMYKLDLDNPRLRVPVAIYEADQGFPRFLAADRLSAPRGNPSAVKDNSSSGLTPPYHLAFFALDRPAQNTIPVYEYERPKGQSSHLTANIAEIKAFSGRSRIAFHALSLDNNTLSSATLVLYSIPGPGPGHVHYEMPSPPPSIMDSRYQPICRTWKKIGDFDPLGQR